MYLRRINVNLYQDIKVLTHYCSTIGKPISGLDTSTYCSTSGKPISGLYPLCIIKLETERL